jgi:hypothetical protein
MSMMVPDALGYIVARLESLEYRNFGVCKETVPEGEKEIKKNCQT